MQIPVPDHPISKRLYDLGKKIFAVHGELPVIEHGSPEWKAWRAWRVEHGLSVNYMDRQDRWTVITTYPPHDLAELEQEWAAKGQRGRISDRTAKALEHHE